MKNTMKKILCSLLVVVMCLTCAPLKGFVGLEWLSLPEINFGNFELPKLDFGSWFSSKASAATEGYYTYTVTNGKATITDVDASISGDVVIPSTLGGYSVTTIGDDAFAYCDSLKSITIPDSVTTIDYGAFDSCTSLTSVIMGDSVTIIGVYAFYNCTSLTSISVDENNAAYSSDSRGALFNKNKTVLIQYPIGNTNLSYTIPDSVTTIGKYAFCDCDSLTSVTIGDNVTTIDDNAFIGCDSLKSVTIGDGVRTIGDYAFQHCDSLTSVTIGDSVRIIGNYAFRYCSSLMSITIPDSVTTIGDSAFFDCTSLTNVTLGDSITTIGGSTLYNTGYYNNSSNWENDVLYIGEYLIGTKNSLSGSYTIKEGTKVIADYGFSRYSSLLSVTIPDSIMTIGYCAFNNCDSLTDVYYDGTETQWSDIEIGSSNDDLLNATIHYANPVVETGKCGDDATYTIYEDGKLIISGTGAIKDYTDNWPAPWEEMKIVDVYISSGITRIGEQAFSGCYDMKYIDIPETVQEFGGRSFAGCRNLSSIHISESVTLIEEGAFSFCNFEEISVDAQNPNYACDESGVLYSVNEKELILFPSASNLETYRIKEGTLSVAYSAFARANHLKTVVCPTSLNSIDDYAFYCCENLTKISLSENLVDIGDSAFAYCEKLEGIKFPKSLNGIGCEAFNGCINLSGTIEVPSVDSYAFQNCKKIQKIIFRGSVISEYSFHMCSDLETVVISNKLKVVDICAFMFTGDIENVYYCGTEEQWRKIKFYGFSGDPLIESNLHYNCCFENSNYQHIYTAEITTEPTHTTVGIKTFTCECGDAYTEEIEKLEGHTYETVVTAPTCTAKGYTTYTCACGESYIDNYTEKLDHKYTSKITIEPTHLTDGVESFTCKCGDTYTKSVPKLTTHTYEEVVTESTHLTEGLKTYTCECGDTYTETIEKLKEHTYEKEVTAPTCTKQGYTTFTCACGDSYVGDYVNEKGHSYSSNTVQPTCTKSGTVTTFCTSCGDTYTETIEATGHNFNGSKCTNCDFDKADNCSCNCHKGGIAGFFFKLILFFQKIFKTNKICSCGVNHY